MSVAKPKPWPRGRGWVLWWLPETPRVIEILPNGIEIEWMYRPGKPRELLTSLHPATIRFLAMLAKQGIL